jgi:hypothetical protein
VPEPSLIVLTLKCATFVREDRLAW